MKSPNPPDKKRGSVILMVIALLTILAMLGSTLVLVARLDRQTSHAIASSAAPAPEVARSVLDMLRADRATDLHISGNLVYGNISRPEDAIDYPYEDINPALDIDPALANIEPIDPAADPPTWRHISHLEHIPNSSYKGGPVPDFSDVVCKADDPNFADTDGDAKADARLFETGITDPDGRPFLAAVRMIDSSGLLNMNTGWDTRLVNASNTMSAVDISLATVIPPAQFSAVLDGRASGLNDPNLYFHGYVLRPLAPTISVTPYDTCDLLRLVSPGADANGRLWERLQPIYNSARNYLTTWSASRIIVPPYVAGTNANRADINLSPASTLYPAFVGIMTCADPGDPDRLAKAAQLTANVVDYRRDDGIPEVVGGNVGTVRRPFISKIFLKRTVDPGGTVYTNYSAIELYNPYVTQISLAGYRLRTASGFVGGAWPSDKVINPGGRFVIGDGSIVPNSAIQIQEQFIESTLDLNTKVPLFILDASGVCVDMVPGSFAAALPPDASNPQWTTFMREDRVQYARYSVADYPCRHFGNPSNNLYDYVTTPNDLGVPNPAAALGSPVIDPRPLYVRHGYFVNVGEVLKLAFLGSDINLPVTERLASAQCFLRTDGPVAKLGPAVPVGCLVSEYLMTDSPIEAALGPDVVYGLVNLNTAPYTVIQCLPALAKLAPGQQQDLANEIISYREQTKGPSTKDYANRDTATGIPGLRNSPGFATSGEVAVPLRQIAGAAVNTYDNNARPGTYAIGDNGSDDGLLLSPGPQDDPDKYNVYYKWLSNQVTVRSDTYIAYILVRSPAGGAGGQRDRRFVALIDRTNCDAAGKLPRVLMMAEVK